MLSGGHYTGVVYCYILSITCLNSTICDTEWWPLYLCDLLLLSITCINSTICDAEWWSLYWCGLLLYIKYYLYKLHYM